MKLPNISGWGWAFLIIALLPVFMSYKKFGLGVIVVPALLILCAYKAGAR